MKAAKKFTFLFLCGETRSVCNSCTYRCISAENSTSFLQNLEIGLFRTDYMFDFDPNNCTNTIKHIESNTICPNYVAMGTKKMAELYRYVLRKAGMDEHLAKLPDDNAAKGLAKIFARAWEMYGSREAVLLVLYDEADRYGFDERLLEYEVLSQNPLIRTVRKTLKEMTACAKLDSERRLFV